jgi:tRNA(Ile2) C34 agmatinyltransferase TiaS
MTGAVLDRPGALFAEAADRPSGGGHPVARGGVTLEELLNATLRVARTHGSAECPVCHARMTSTRTGAACEGCGSRLS